VGPPLDGVTEVEVDGQACLFSPVTNQVLLLNQTASDVWYLCDGTMTLAAVVQRLADVYDVPPNRLRADVRSAVESFVDAGLLSWP
jgi:hypothetical protein